MSYTRVPGGGVNRGSFLPSPTPFLLSHTPLRPSSTPCFLSPCLAFLLSPSNLLISPTPSLLSPIHSLLSPTSFLPPPLSLLPQPCPPLHSCKKKSVCALLVLRSLNHSVEKTNCMRCRVTIKPLFCDITNSIF